MLNNAGKFLIFFLMAVILTAGCIQQTTPGAPVVAPSITISTPTPAVTPVMPDTVIPTTSAGTPATSVVPTKTLLPEADPTDISKITFLHYSDGDFSMDYPSTWTITTSYTTPYPVGPFYLYDDPRLNTPYRVVTFTSPDKTKKFVALTQDFSQAGRFVLNPTIDWAKAMFEKNYPDLSPLNYLGSYKYFSSGNTMASTYDVTLPKGSRYYPSAYSVKTIITTRHIYNFGFFTDTENFTTYQTLKERILSSITTNNG